jgi:uncharacterized protein YndB with AHSA1/START domain
MAQTTRSRRHIQAPPGRVYALLLDREAVRRWKVPDGMSSQVHAFEPRVGGTFRVSLTYESPDSRGKSGEHTDTYHGHFASLVPDSLVVEVVEFESAGPAMSGTMTITYTLSPTDDGTDLVAVHEDLPDGVSAVDNELGWRMSLDKLAALAEGREQA